MFLLAVCGVVWYPDEPSKKDSAHQSVLAVSIPAAALNDKKVCGIFFFCSHKLDSSTFSAQFPLNAVIYNLRNMFQSPLSTCYWLTCTQAAKSAPSLDISALLSLSLCLRVWMCVCSAVSSHSERHQSDSPIPSKRPSSQSETSESPLSSKRPRTAEKSAAEQVRCKPHNFDNSDVFRCS